MTITILTETLSYLRFNCIWPNAAEELNPSKSFYIKFILMLISNSAFLFGSTGHLIVSIQNNSNNITEDLVIIIAEIGVYYFIATFVSHQKNISAIYNELSDFEKFEKPHNFDERNKRLLFLSKAYKSFIDLAIINFCLYPFFTKKICEKENEERDFKEVCGLLVTTWMPFNIDFFPVKQILYLWQCYVIVFTMKGAALISFAIMESMEHLVVRIQHLKVMLTQAVGTEEASQRQKLFSRCIEYHIHIFDIGKRLDKYYTGCLFLHVLLSGALFGCIGYRFMESFSLNSLCIFNGWVLSLYIVCISGQHLIDEATSVAQAAYDSKWYERDVNFQKNIVFIMLRSQTPIVVHAGPFSYVSHIIILTIFKTAYSYLTLLKTASM